MLYHTMSLYGNILSSRKESGKGDQENPTDKSKTTPSASMKFLQEHLMSKRRHKQQVGSNQKLPIKQSVKTANSESSLPLRRFCGEPCNWDPQDEYDPTTPNNYDILQSDYLKAEERKLLAASSASGKVSKDIKIDTKLLDALDELDDHEEGDNIKIRGTAIAPPLALRGSTSTIASNQRESDDTDRQERGQVLSSESRYSGQSVGVQMNIGHKSHLTPVSDEQSTVQPLGVDIMNKRLDKISSELDISSSQTDLRSSCDQVVPYQTRVVLLQNMVGPGQVDDDLEAETKEECAKYGEVIKCLIFEIPNKQVPDDQAVRIFVEFRTKQAAAKATSDLNGRYFGGRIVRASFYDENRFARYELSP